MNVPIPGIARPALLIALLGSILAAGCDSDERGTDAPRRKNPPPARTVSEPAQSSRKTTRTAAQNAPAATDESPARERSGAAPLPDGPRTLADLVSGEDDTTDKNADGPPAQPTTPFAPAEAGTLPVDDTRAALAGIRKLTGKHLTVYTDVPIGPKVDVLPAMFDLAVPQWCAYFGVDPSAAESWHITGFVMQDKTRFQATGLLPDDLPPFSNGYQRGPYIWAYDQPDTYYCRHLVLHEGTHAFMDRVLGSFGPPWYAEGMAELLGTHRLQNGQLRLGYFPQDKTETPGWGRIKIIQDELAEGRGKMPENIMEYGPRAHLQNAPYGWCWGLAAFLDAHPQSQQVFRQLPRRLRSGDPTAWFRQQLQDRWSSLAEDWQIFVMDIDYGYDIARAAVVRRPAVPLPADGATATVAADRGWQSTGIRLEPDVAYQITASGRYQVAETSEVWWCEPGGVTIHYYNSRPLGMLLGAVRDDSNPLRGLSPFVRPEPIGLQATWTPKQGGTLYLKINESAADLNDNEGAITVRIQTVPPT